MTLPSDGGLRQICTLMSFTEFTEAFLAKIAGWQAMKNARGLVAADKVLSSNWTPPLRKGVVSEGSTSYRAGLVIFRFLKSTYTQPRAF